MLFEQDVLRRHTSDAFRKLLTGAGDRIELPERDVLFEENDDGDSLYVLLEGRIELTILFEDGRRLGLDVISAGSVFGEIALFDPGPRTATATALDPCKLLRLRHSDLKREMMEKPDLAFELMRLMGQRMRWMNQQLNEFVFMPLPKRLARKLLYFAPSDDVSGTSFKVSQAELAELSGATREAVSKVLSSWKRQGILKTGRGSVELLDRPALREIADF